MQDCSTLMTSINPADARSQFIHVGSPLIRKKDISFLVRIDVLSSPTARREATSAEKTSHDHFVEQNANGSRNESFYLETEVIYKMTFLEKILQKVFAIRGGMFHSKIPCKFEREKDFTRHICRRNKLVLFGPFWFWAA